MNQRFYDFVKYVAQALSEEVANHEKAVSLGKCADFGEYKYQVGIIRGLMIANGLAQEALERLERDDDD